jgi:hypothetical protein
MRYSFVACIADSSLMYPDSSLPNFNPPALANGHSATAVPSPYLFPNVPECHFAQQLTRMDMVSTNKFILKLHLKRIEYMQYISVLHEITTKQLSLCVIYICS